MALNLREVEVFKPYPDEVPEALFASELDELQLDRALAAEFVRIAKHDGAIIGAYAMDRDASDRYVLHAVVVDTASRHQGLGRWLVGHAIGVTESKGGRALCLATKSRRRFFERIGFVEEAAGQRYDLVPE